MKLRSLSRRWAARGTVAAVTALTVTAGMQTAASAAADHSAAVAATTRSTATSPTDPYSPAYHHAYRHGVVPTRAIASRMRTWASQHRVAHAAAGKDSSFNLLYSGGPNGVATSPPRVYLVFYGSQWGTRKTNTNGDVTLSGDPSGEAPLLQELFKGVGSTGTHQDLWSGVMTQYCDGVAVNAQSCPSNASFVGYPTGGALAGVWVDETAASPATASGHQLGVEAVKAAAHFGNKTGASNLGAQYVIVSPHGTNPDGWLNNGFCAWHDFNGDSTLSGGPVTSSYGNIAFTNFPYVTDLGASCGANFVNSGSAGADDGITIVEGHEYAETITDQFPPAGWLDSSFSENADKCAWVVPAADVTFSTGTFPMQPTWANDANSATDTGGCELSHAIAVSDAGQSSIMPITSPGGQTATVGTPITPLQITAADTDSGQTVTYSAAGLPPGLSINSGNGTISGTPTAGGTYTTSVTASDTSGSHGTTSFVWVVELLANPGFENGTLSPWTATAKVLQPSSATYPAHSGNWLAKLDGAGTTHTDTLAQKVTVTRTGPGATFSFYLNIKSNDPTSNAQAWDTLKVQVLNTSGTVLQTLTTYSNKNTRNSYLKHSFSLKSYLGKTIILKFTGKETLTKHNTAFLVDDTALNVS